MKRILAPILLLTLLFPSLAFGGTRDDLVVRDGIHYKKFTDVPFTGQTTGRMQRSYKDGKLDGPLVLYHANGQLAGKGTWKDGKIVGPWVRYHDNGKFESKGTYKNEEYDGPWVWYHINGQLYTKGTFKNGKREGPWVWYNKDGTVSKEFTGTFKNGVKVK